jgi:hypothetical protein
MRFSQGTGGEAAGAAMVMTQQYLAGELSLLLAQLQTVVTNEASVSAVARLRREAETQQSDGLVSVAIRALALGDGVCWEAVTCGDTAAFSRRSAASAELYQFGLCAGLLDVP